MTLKWDVCAQNLKALFFKGSNSDHYMTLLLKPFFREFNEEEKMQGNPYPLPSQKLKGNF
jgi:hypothetical protein